MDSDVLLRPGLIDLLHAHHDQAIPVAYRGLLVLVFRGDHVNLAAPNVTILHVHASRKVVGEYRCHYRLQATANVDQLHA